MMPLRGPALEEAMRIAFEIAFALWFGLSLFVVASRLAYDRRARVLGDMAAQLKVQLLAASSAQLSLVVERALYRLSRRRLLRLMSDTSQPSHVTDAVAGYTLARCGLSWITAAASMHHGSERWRRIGALRVLAHVGSPSTHTLLERALFDGDTKLTRAALVMLREVGDRRAAVLLISALGARAYNPSRIATELEQFAVPIDDLLRPMLSAPQPHVRYWAAALLARSRGMTLRDIAPLVDDADAPVRKVALVALSDLRHADVAPIALRRLNDPVAYVRSAAVHVVARSAANARADVRHARAARVATLLSDRDWGVRDATKQALSELGADVWRDVSAQLDAPDPFARNGAAEVLQNSGVLDRWVDDVGRGRRIGDERLSSLERAFHEGGSRMIEAAAARCDRALFPTVHHLRGGLRLAGVSLST